MEKKNKILIVEDEQVTALTIQKMLEPDYEVVGIVSSGEEAVEKVEEHRPDLVLMDIILEGQLNGIQAAEKIISRFDIPVVYITAYSDEETLSRAKITQPYGYLVKPINSRELQVTIEVSLHNHEMEKKLRESEEKYRHLFNSIRDAILVADTEGKIIDCNNAFTELFGYTLDEIKGKKTQFVYKDMDEYKRMGEFIAENVEQPNFVFNINYKNKSGEVFLGETSIFYLKDSNGELLGFIGLIRDITEKKKAEEAAKEHRRELETLMSNLPGMVYRCKNVPEWTMEFVSGSQPLTGYEPWELINDKKVAYGDLIHPDDSETVWNDVQKMLKEDEHFELEYRIITKDKQEKWVWERGRGIFDDGDLLFLEGFITDITERKMAVEKLKESEQRYRTTFEFTGTAMMIIEEDTTLSMVNTGVEEITGYTKEEIEGKMSWTEFIHPDDVEKMKSYHYARRRGEKTPNKYEFRYVDREGNVKNALFHIGMIPGTKRSVASIIDITYLRRLNSLLDAISQINEMVARERSPEVVLETVCERLNTLYEGVFTSIIRDGELEPVKSKGIDISHLKKTIKQCPSIKKAMEDKTMKISTNSELCQHCTKEPHKYAFSVPLIHDRHRGVVTIHSNSDFSEEEVNLLQKLANNIGFALYAYEVEEERKEAMKQLAVNLYHFDKSADKLRNPLAVIISSLELIDKYGKDKTIEIVDEQVKRLEIEIDELRKEETSTFNLIDPKYLEDLGDEDFEDINK